MSDTNDERLRNLMTITRNTVNRWRSGHHPTFSQLDHLEAILDSCDTMLLCGHTLMDECDCIETLRAAKGK